MLDAESYPWEQISASVDRPEPRRGRDRPRRAATVACAADRTRSSGTPSTRAPASRRRSPRRPRRSRDPGGHGVRTCSTCRTPARTARSSRHRPASGPSRSTASGRAIALPETPGGTVHRRSQAWYTATTQPGRAQAVGELTSGALTASDRLFGGAPLRTFDDPDHNLVERRLGERSPAPLIEARSTTSGSRRSGGSWTTRASTSRGPRRTRTTTSSIRHPRASASSSRPTRRTGRSRSRCTRREPPTAALGVADAGAAPGDARHRAERAGGPARRVRRRCRRRRGGPDPHRPGRRRRRRHRPGRGRIGGCRGRRAAARAGDERQRRAERRAVLAPRAVHRRGARGRSARRGTPPQTADPGRPRRERPRDRDDQHDLPLRREALRRHVRRGGGRPTCATRSSSLTGDGHVGAGAVDGAVLADRHRARRCRRARDGARRATRARCRRARALTSAINAFVGEQLGAPPRRSISSVVIVGGDDIIPLAPVAQHTSQFTEDEPRGRPPARADSDGRAVPDVAGLCVDPCETPLSAAAATSHILTDDPYGLATAYESLGGYLYVPTVALGRLVETPDQIIATIDRFLARRTGVLDGRLDADRRLRRVERAPAAGHRGARLALAPSTSSSATLWTAADLDEPAVPRRRARAPGSSRSTRTPTRRGCSPACRARSPAASPTPTCSSPTGHEDAAAARRRARLRHRLPCRQQPAGRLLRRRHRLGRRLLAGGRLHRQHGLRPRQQRDDGPRRAAARALLPTGSASRSTATQCRRPAPLTYAKQSYLGGLGPLLGLRREGAHGGRLLRPADVHVRRRRQDQMPLPETPDLTPSTDGRPHDGGVCRSSPEFRRADRDRTAGRVPHGRGRGALAVAAASAILPSIVRALEPAPTGWSPRGVILTSLTSVIDDDGHARPVTAPTVGVPETTATGPGLAFPSTFATITQQQTPRGPVDLLVVTPARVADDAGGSGHTERFTSFTAEVVYGDATSTDTTAADDRRPSSVPAPGSRTTSRSTRLETAASPPSSCSCSPRAQTEWQRMRPSRRRTTPTDGIERYWQARRPSGRSAGCCRSSTRRATSPSTSARGHLDVAGAVAPTLGDAGPDVTVAVGERLHARGPGHRRHRRASA